MMIFLRRHGLAILFLFIALGAGGVAWYYYQKANTADSSTQGTPALDDKALLAKIGLLIELPDEQPTIARVSDPERLKNQAFFERAKKGDVVVIYTKSRKAILYDPIANKIIDVAPINIDN